jgi:hypothetical protein
MSQVSEITYMHPINGQIVTIPSGSAKKFRYERAGWKVIRPKVR